MEIHKSIKYDYKGDPYGSHMPVLEKLFKTFDICRIIEFGIGNHSTPFFLINSCYLMSIEMQEKKWFDKVVMEMGDNENWKPVLSIGPFEFYNINYEENIDFAFIDGHIESRPECINLMFEKRVPIIAAHDTEKKVYGWGRVNVPNDYKTIVNIVGIKNTTLFIRNDYYSKQHIF